MYYFIELLVVVYQNMAPQREFVIAFERRVGEMAFPHDVTAGQFDRIKKVDEVWIYRHIRPQ